MFEASIAPSAPPAPTIVCISSTNKIMSPASLISRRIFFTRSSNSPRYLVPATKVPISRETIRLSANSVGTSPSAIRWASPSAIAVFPTPGSPSKTGLFFDRRIKISITRLISFSRPEIGSISPFRAILVRSRPSSSINDFCFRGFSASLRIRLNSDGANPNWSNVVRFTFATSISKFFKIRTARESGAARRANNKCSVPISSDFNSPAILFANLKVAFNPGV